MVFDTVVNVNFAVSHWVPSPKTSIWSDVQAAFAANDNPDIIIAHNAINKRFIISLPIIPDVINKKNALQKDGWRFETILYETVRLFNIFAALQPYVGDFVILTHTERGVRHPSVFLLINTS